MSDVKALGDRLRSRRLELGLTLAQVAERAGLSLPYVSNLERGRGNPTIDAVGALARALETTVPSLLGEALNRDPLDLVLASAPRSLLAFSRSTRFLETIERLARKGTTVEDLRRRMLIGLASAPRRSSGEPTEDDWRRILDAYTLILDE